MADELSGFPRHLSIHVGGFVLSSRPLYEVSPVEPARMEDRTVVPWDKEWIKSATKATRDHILTEEQRDELRTHYALA